MVERMVEVGPVVPPLEETKKEFK